MSDHRRASSTPTAVETGCAGKTPEAGAKVRCVFSKTAVSPLGFSGTMLDLQFEKDILGC